MNRVFSAALLGLAIFTLPTQGQPPAPAKAEAKDAVPFKEEKLPIDRKDMLEFGRDYKEVGLFRRMWSGEEKVDTAEEKALIRRFARFYTYRLTWPEIQEGREKLTIENIMEGGAEQRAKAGDLSGALNAIPTITDDPGNKVKNENRHLFIRELRSAMTPFLQEVLRNRPIARLNAARILHRFAQVGQEEVIDEFVKILDNPQEHDFMRHWAILGLGEIFARMAKDPTLPEKEPVGAQPKRDWTARMERMERGGMAVYKWLEARSNLDSKTVSQMSVEEQDGVRFVRQAAMRTLASLRRPLVVERHIKQPDFTIKSTQQGPTAELLIRIMNNEQDKVSPEASWEERVTAALCLFQMKPRLSKSFQSDVAFHHVGQFIAGLSAEKPAGEHLLEFAVELRKGTELPRKDAFDPADKKGQDFYESLFKQMDPALQNLYKADLSPGGPEQLRTWLRDSAPKKFDLYNPPLSPK